LEHLLQGLYGVDAPGRQYCYSATFQSCFRFYARQPSLRCPSVRLSVTPWHCVKTATPRITQSSLWTTGFYPYTWWAQLAPSEK